MAITGNPGDLATGGFGTGVRGVAATPRDLANAVARQESMAVAREIGQGSNIGTGFRGPVGTWGSPGSIVPGSLLDRATRSPLSPYGNAFRVTQDDLINAAIANATLLGSGDPLNPSLGELQSLAKQVQESPELQGVLASVYGPFLNGTRNEVPPGLLSQAVQGALPTRKDEVARADAPPSAGPAPYDVRSTPDAPSEIDPFTMSNLLAGENDVMRYTSPVAMGTVQDMPGALRSGGARLHAGMDFSAPTGTPVTPSMPGTVVQVGNASGYGPFVDIQDINGQIQRYAVHNTGTVNVREGDYVAPGDVIGTVGAQGTGPDYFQHLHFENISPSDAAYNEIMQSYASGNPSFAGATSTPRGTPIRSSTQALADQMGLTTGMNVAGLLPDIPYTTLGGRPVAVASNVEMPMDVVPEEINPVPPTQPPARRPAPVFLGPSAPFNRVATVTPAPSPAPAPVVVADAMPAPEYAEPTATLTMPSGILGPAPYDVRGVAPTDITPRPAPSQPVVVAEQAPSPAPVRPRPLPPRTPTPTTLERMMAQLFGGSPTENRAALANQMLASASPQARGRDDRQQREQKRPEDLENDPQTAQPVQLSQSLLPDWYWQWYKSRGLTGGLLA